MCMSHRVTCRCGERSADLTMRDGIVGPEVVRELYCPECARDRAFDAAAMLEDNGWWIVYDMDVAESRANMMPRGSGRLTPEFLFDEGYCTWVGYCPGDMARAADEKAEIVKLMKVDPKAYVKAFTSWARNRVVRLSDEGWRKARTAAA